MNGILFLGRQGRQIVLWFSVNTLVLSVLFGSIICCQLKKTEHQTLL